MAVYATWSSVISLSCETIIICKVSNVSSFVVSIYIYYFCCKLEPIMPA